MTQWSVVAEDYSFSPWYISISARTVLLRTWTSGCLYLVYGQVSHQQHDLIFSPRHKVLGTAITLSSGKHSSYTQGWDISLCIVISSQVLALYLLTLRLLSLIILLPVFSKRAQPNCSIFPFHSNFFSHFGMKIWIMGARAYLQCEKPLRFEFRTELFVLKVIHQNKMIVSTFRLIGHSGKEGVGWVIT